MKPLIFCLIFCLSAAAQSPNAAPDAANIIALERMWNQAQVSLDPKFKPGLMNIDDVKVEMYPSTAIVTGNYHVKGVYGAKPYEHFGRFTDTWVLQDSKWLCVASHTNLLKK